MARKKLLAFLLIFFSQGGLEFTYLRAAEPAAPSVYKDLCTGCHGEGGKGDGPAAVGLNPKPKDFTDCEAMAAVSNETAFKAIKDGGQSVGVSPMMPSWKAFLQDQQIKDLVTYIRGFCSK